ncbi:MAG: FAD-binding oxidoreductase [Sulfolobus sp.]
MISDNFIKVLEKEFYDKVIFDKEKIREASRSPYNISPHLKKFERDADVLFKPISEEDIEILLKICEEYRVPVIPFGGRSGTLGQTIPIYGGVLVDMNSLRGEPIVDKDSIAVKPGNKVFEVLRKLRKYGKELMVYPSSYYIATMGGYIGAGNVGIGAFQYGYFYHNALISAKIYSPRGSRILNNVLGIAQAAGTTGIVTEAEFKTVDIDDWRDQILSFDETESFLKLINYLYESREYTRRVTIEDKETFEKVTGIEGRRWNVIVSSKLKLGTEVDKVFDKIAFAAIYVYFYKNNPFKNYHYEAMLMEFNDFIKVSGELKRTLGKGIMIHGDLMSIKGKRIVYAVFMSERENFIFIMERLKENGYYYNLHSYQINDYHEDPEVIREIIRLKREVDPKDILNRGKLRY